MFVSTTDYLPGANYQIIGLVSGNVAYSKNIGRDIMAGFKNIAGGEIKSYTDMVQEARQIAEQRMEEDAVSKGANGIIGVRLMNDTVAEGTIEVVVYGTAIKFL